MALIKISRRRQPPAPAITEPSLNNLSGGREVSAKWGLLGSGTVNERLRRPAVPLTMSLMTIWTCLPEHFRTTVKRPAGAELIAPLEARECSRFRP